MENGYNIFFIFLFTICVLTIKLSSIPIVVILVASFYYAWKMIKPRQIIFLSLFCVVFFSPWVARNVILSGYVLYPFPSWTQFTAPMVCADSSNSSKNGMTDCL